MLPETHRRGIGPYVGRGLTSCAASSVLAMDYHGQLVFFENFPRVCEAALHRVLHTCVLGNLVNRKGINLCNKHPTKLNFGRVNECLWKYVPSSCCRHGNHFGAVVRLHPISCNFYVEFVLLSTYFDGYPDPFVTLGLSRQSSRKVDALIVFCRNVPNVFVHTLQFKPILRTIAIKSAHFTLHVSNT